MLCAYFVVLTYYSVFLIPLVFRLKDSTEEKTEALSLVLCARNEEEILLQKIPLLLSQDYPNYELVLVDDCSVDGTWEIMKAFEKKDPRVKLVRVNENDQFYTSKKYALTLGIKAAQHDLIVFTDADCRPDSRTWLRAMSSTMSEGKKIVLGFGDYEIRKGFLNALIRFDTLLIALQYMSFARNGLAYMGVGRNLAYRKSLFLAEKGFAKHQHIDSGDDDLFIGQAANKSNTAINFSKEAKTWSEPKSSLLDWVRQKGRHLTTYKHYRPKNSFAVGLLNISQALCFTLGIFFLFSPYYIISASLLTFKGLLLSFVMLKIRKEHSLPSFILIPLIWELILYAIYPSFFVSSRIYKKGTWKI